MMCECICFCICIWLHSVLLCLCAEKAAVCCNKGGVWWVSRWYEIRFVLLPLCCLCGNVWHHYHSNVCITVMCKISLCVCVCVAGISQVLRTTPCSMLMECRRTSLNRWVISMYKSIQIFIFTDGNRSGKHLSTSWRDRATDLSQPFRCFCVWDEKSLFKKHGSESQLCQRFLDLRWSAGHMTPLMLLKVSVRQTERSKGQGERKKQRKTAGTTLGFLVSSDLLRKSPLETLPPLWGWRQGCRSCYNAVR